MDDLFSFSEKKIFTVSGLNDAIKGTLESGYAQVWLEGEVSNLRIPQSGHCYLTLKDDQSQIKAILFKSTLKEIRFLPREGQFLLCSGRLTVYAPRGEYQIILESAEPKGAGALQAAFEQLKEKLRLLGWFSPERKRALPPFPSRIGIITSPTGAAIRDMLQIIKRRHPAVDILIYPVPVQGQEAPGAIARAIAEMNRMGGIDVLIVGRGGGSFEDLWAFNEEIVAEAIYRSGIPVISAVGHETDVTISDFVADLRAPTPSAAAELVVKNHVELVERIFLAQNRLAAGWRRNLALWNQKCHALRERIPSPRRMIENYFQRCDDRLERLTLAMTRGMGERKLRLDTLSGRLDLLNPAQHLKRMRERSGQLTERLFKQIAGDLLLRRRAVDSLTSNLKALGPLAILARGYSITRKMPEKRILKSSRNAETGESIEIILSDGSLAARITGRNS
jgi:exodeoxyribonuclease VII large subunit